MKKGCCLYDQSFYKVNDTHQSGVTNLAPNPFVLVLISLYADFICSKNYANQEALIQCSNGPPNTHLDTPLFLLNSNFRI